MATPATLNNVIHEPVGGGTQVTKSGGLVTLVDYREESDEVETGEGVSRKVGFRLGFEFRYHEIDVFDALNTIMLADGQRRFSFAWPGLTHQIEPVGFTVVPVIGVLNDKCKLYIAAEGTAGPPPGAGWTDLGLILGGSTPNLSVNPETDGCGRPVYVNTEFEWTVDFLDAQAGSNLDPYYTAKAKLAIDHGDSTFTYFDAVRVTNFPATGRLLTTRAVFTATYADVTAATAIVIPGGWAVPTAPAFFNGATVNGVASGATRGAVLTEI